MVLLNQKSFSKLLSPCFKAEKLMKIPNVPSLCALLFSLTYTVHQSKTLAAVILLFNLL